MLILLTMNKLKQRAKASGISLQDVCARAGVHKNTPSKLMKPGRQGRVSTLVRLNVALFEIERERRAHLAGLGPLGETPEQEGQAA